MLYLLDNIRNCNVVDSKNSKDGRTLLHLAAVHNDAKLCQTLIDNGASVDSLLITASVSTTIWIFSKQIGGCISLRTII